MGKCFEYHTRAFAPRPRRLALNTVISHSPPYHQVIQRMNQLLILSNTNVVFDIIINGNIMLISYIDTVYMHYCSPGFPDDGVLISCSSSASHSFDWLSSRFELETHAKESCVSGSNLQSSQSNKFETPVMVDNMPGLVHHLSSIFSQISTRLVNKFTMIPQ